MCKAASKGIVIKEVRLIEKTGGKSGTWRADDDARRPPESSARHELVRSRTHAGCEVVVRLPLPPPCGGEACDSATLYALGAAFANDTQVVVAPYEAFRNDAGGELTRVFRELGMAASGARKTPPRTMKRSPEALSRVFANHKDLARALKRWAPKGCRLEGMILDTKGTRPFRCNAARACDHFKELERACRGGGEC